MDAEFHFCQIAESSEETCQQVGDAKHLNQGCGMHHVAQIDILSCRGKMLISQADQYYLN